MKFRGVSERDGCGYVASIGVNGRRVHLGYFKSFTAARQARLDAEVEHFGAVFDRREIEVDGEVARIPLHGQRGVFKGWALVDLADLARVAGTAWTIDPRGYVVGRPAGLGKPTTMHRWLIGDAVIVDHRSRDRLDNRRANLRACTPAENARNTKISKNNSSGSKGVSAVQCGNWRARIWVGRKEHHLGTFASKAEAEAAYDLAAIELHGQFASTNAELRSGHAELPPEAG